jgi:hypothetical protein
MRKTIDIVATARYHNLGYLFRHGKGECWLEFALQLIGTKDSHLAHAGGIILHCAAAEFTTLPDSLRIRLNQGSVDLIHYYWQSPEIDKRVRAPLKWICKSIESAPEISKQLIRSVISREQIQETGYIHASTLADQIVHIMRNDPSLAVEVYEAVFSYRESDETKTPITDSQILSLISTRRQDYQSARYALRESFPGFLRACPSEATRALIGAIRGVLEQDVELIQESQLETFDWVGRECRINDDASGLRFSEPSPYDDEGQMLLQWEVFLVELPDRPSAEQDWIALREVLVSKNGSASIWRSLLKAAHQKPEFYSPNLANMLLVPRILFGAGTRTMARNCLRSFAVYLGHEFLTALQELVLGTKEYKSAGREPLNNEYLTELKIMILAAIPPGVRNDETRQFLSNCDWRAVHFAEKRGSETDEVTFTRTWSAANEHKLINDLQTDHPTLVSIKFLAGLSPQHVTEANLPKVLEHIETVETRLAEGDSDPHYNRVPAAHWLIYASAAIACSRLPFDILPADRLIDRFQSVLSCPCAEPEKDDLVRFDDFPSWERPDPLVEAAMGFSCLEEKTFETNEEWLALLRLIASHPCPRVRYQLIDSFPVLFAKRPEFVVETFELWVCEAREMPGRFALIISVINQGLLWSLRSLDQPRTERLIGEFCDIIHENGSVDFRNGCGKLTARYHIHLAEPWAGARINAALTDFHNYDHEIYGFAICCSECIFRPFTEVVPWDENLERATALISDCLGTAHEALKQYVSQTQSEPESHEDVLPEWARQAVNIFDLVAVEFARCVHASLKHLKDSRQDPDPEKLEAWWKRVEPVLELLMLEPYPKIVYPLIHAFKDIALLSPVRVFQWLTEITRAGTPYGLDSEESAVNDSIEILERLLADQLIDFKSESTLVGVVEIVETYLRAGWQRAFEFSTQLEEIFR